MASSLLTEKLDRTNYASWSYKMHQYMLGHGYWSYVEGANDAAPESPGRLHKFVPSGTKIGQSEHYLFQLQVLKPLVVDMAYPLVPQVSNTNV